MVNHSNLSIKMSKACIATNRFGYGAKKNELIKAKINPKEWVLSQLKPIAFNALLPHSNDVLIEHANYRKLKKKAKSPLNKKSKRYARNALITLSSDTLNQAISSTNSVSWRLLDFFSNHFSVSANGRLMVGLAATLEREAIAPNLLGKFEDMLLAVVQHPAMLIYLNNEKSFGPNSRMAKKSQKGLNENLAREILELHTLGVNSGYRQNDVISLAKGISGWSVKNPKKERNAGFIFRAYGHEPGQKILLGKVYAQKGIAQGAAMLRDLALNTNTAKHICYKLAQHFIADNPAQTLRDKMESVWRESNGNIKQVMQCLINADESWIESPQKFKTPREFVISTFRALSFKRNNEKLVLNSLRSLGQQPFMSGSPAGFSDNESDWLGGSALIARIDWATEMSGYRKRINTESIMNASLGGSVNVLTYKGVLNAESQQQALTLFLMSPEFQRR